MPLAIKIIVVFEFSIKHHIIIEMQDEFKS